MHKRTKFVILTLSLARHTRPPLAYLFSHGWLNQPQNGGENKWNRKWPLQNLAKHMHQLNK